VKGSPQPAFPANQRSPFTRHLISAILDQPLAMPFAGRRFLSMAENPPAGCCGAAHLVFSIFWIQLHRACATIFPTCSMRRATRIERGSAGDRSRIGRS